MHEYIYKPLFCLTSSHAYGSFSLLLSIAINTVTYYLIKAHFTPRQKEFSLTSFDRRFAIHTQSPPSRGSATFNWYIFDFFDIFQKILVYYSPYFSEYVYTFSR